MTDPVPTPAAEPQPEPIVEVQPQTDLQTLPQPVGSESGPLLPRARPLHYYALWVVAIASLALNIFIIYTLLQVKQQAGLAFSQAAEAMGSIKDSSIKYVVNIDEEIPIALDVPVKFTVTVPIQKTIPIDTIVIVPIELPLIGTREIAVPIKTSILIDLSVEVPIDKSIPINATIPVKFEVPIDLDLSETTFGQGLGEFQLVLQQQAEGLGAGAKP